MGIQRTGRHGARQVFRGTTGGVEWMLARSARARGIVLVPPLIGGHAVQQLRLLRSLPSRRLDLLSFNYAGHGRSRGSFSLGASLSNAVEMMDLALSLARRMDLPLFGLASCYAAVPLLHAVRKYNEPLAGVVLVNAVTRWRPGPVWGSFMNHWTSTGQGSYTPRGFLGAAADYLHALFPGLIRDNGGFGILAFNRMRWLRLLGEAVSLRPLENIRLENTPVLCVYGLEDQLLQQLGWREWPGYEAQIRHICPLAQFHPVVADHYLGGHGLRRRLAAMAAAFFLSRGDRGQGLRNRHSSHWPQPTASIPL